LARSIVTDTAVERTAGPIQRAAVRRTLPGVGILSAAMLASGALAYLFHILGARSLDAAAYGSLAVLWAALFLAVVVLYRPLEQTLARAIADRMARGDEVRSVVLSVVAVYVATLVVGVAAAVFLWGTIADALFEGSSTFTAALFVGVYGYGLEYLVRGILSGGRWFGGYGLALMTDGVSRLVVALPLVVVASPAVAAAAVAAAGICGAVVPAYTHRGELRSVLARGAGARFRHRSVIAFAGPAAIIAAADQLLVNGSPLLVMAGNGADAVEAAGVVFAATMLVRIPVYVFQGPAASLLPNLTRLHAHADTGAFRRAMVKVGAALLAVSLGIVAAAATIGPWCMTTLFGSGFEASSLELTLLGAGVGCYLTSATLSQALLAVGAVRATAAAWTLSAVVFVVLYAILEGEPLLRISEAFAVATAVGAVAIAVVAAVRLRRR
jgi:O-antigen/teichoic acid export membrane protein